MSAKVWPFPLLRNYSTSEALSSLFFDFAESGPVLSDSSNEYWIVVTSPLGTLKFWGSNKYYAWANCGDFVSVDGIRSSWYGEMPSRAAVRAMARGIDKRRFRYERPAK